MTIRTFRAPSVGEALAQVKKEMGGSAVILHTRTYKVGGVLGVGAKTITEITATTEMTVNSRLSQKTKPATASVAAANSASASGGSMPAPKSAPARGAQAGRVHERLAATLSTAETTERAQVRGAVGTGSDRPGNAAFPSSTAAQSPFPVPVTLPARTVAAAAADISLTAQLRDEMAMLRRLVGRVVQNGGGGPAMPEALQSCYLKMIESEVASEIADAVVAGVCDELPQRSRGDAAATRAAVLRRLAAYIPASDSPPETFDPSRTRDGRPTTIALVGPTGVGKTTTIAKLAATYKLRMGKRVGLVTADTYRIAAVEQLRTYAGIIGLPLRVALTPQEMRSGCEALRECDVILVDTAGRSPGDAGKLSELGSFLDAAVPHQVHLVLSSAASEACLRQAVASFAAVGPTHLIYTKLDEAVSFGVLVNIARKVNAKLSFVTTGQEVPDHIESGNAHRLASLILEGGAVR